jgi:hypothetical protein
LTVTSLEGGGLRNIRIQPKQGRRKKTSDEPECISISSDEEGAEEEEANSEPPANETLAKEDEKGKGIIDLTRSNSYTGG